MTEEAQRAAVIAEAETWLNTPYRHQARVKGAGVDCGMLLLEVFSAAGVIEAQTVGDYSRDFHLHRNEERYLEQLLRYADEITGPPQPGDIAVWRFGRSYAHGALVVSWPTIIHSYVGLGVVYGDAQADQDLVERPYRWFSCWK
ncbi:hypothetical protein ACJJJB_00020 (plasmid) [Microbulbifer sp. ANSA001]|uniref:hypothetical protein n=1 Tax=Microbulbifer sp. ANSA001 TaxID=3243358 RepID=UPI0040435E0C